MSITSDIRTYADTAVAEGKKVLDSTISTAQAQLGGVTGQASEFVGKYRDNVATVADRAGEAVSDLRASAEKAVNIGAIKSAVEPYLAQVNDYRAGVQDRADGIYTSLRKDKRVGKFVDAAGNVTVVVVAAVQERVVKPVQSFTGLGTQPTAAAKAGPAKAAKPAATRPATAKPAAKKTTTRPAARKTATKRTTKA